MVGDPVLSIGTRCTVRYVVGTARVHGQPTGEYTVAALDTSGRLHHLETLHSRAAAWEYAMAANRLFERGGE